MELKKLKVGETLILESRFKIPILRLVYSGQVSTEVYCLSILCSNGQATFTYTVYVKKGDKFIIGFDNHVQIGRFMDINEDKTEVEIEITKES